MSDGYGRLPTFYAEDAISEPTTGRQNSSGLRMKLTGQKHLPWLLSAITIYAMWLAGSMSPWAWILGLVAQALWLVWIIPGKHWGFIPMNIALWIVYARNLYLWTQS